MTAEQIAAIIAGLHAPLLPGEFLELRATHQNTGEIRREWFRSEMPLAQTALAWSKQRRHCYFSLHPRIGRQAGDANCARALCLPADVDAKLWQGDTLATRHAVEAFAFRPSLAVSSGGGMHIYWRLRAALDLQAEPERYRLLCRRLARALCGRDRMPDKVSQPEIVLRVPGALNWKYQPAREVTVLWWEPERRYDAASIEDWLDANAPWTLPPPEPPRPSREMRPVDGVIEDFNARYDLLGLLARHGAGIGRERRGGTYIWRPGKDARGRHDATYGHYPNILYVFGANWPPFEQARGYDHFEAYSLLEHGGDRKAAYAAAKEAGYGTRFGLRIDGGSSAAATTRLLQGAR